MKMAERIDSIKSNLKVLLALECFTALARSELKELTQLGVATLKRAIDFLKTYEFDLGPLVFQDPQTQKWAITTKGIKFLAWIGTTRERKASKWRRVSQDLKPNFNELRTKLATDLKPEKALYVPFRDGQPRGESLVRNSGIAIIRNAENISVKEAEERVKLMRDGSAPWENASIEYYYSQRRTPRKYQFLVDGY